MQSTFEKILKDGERKGYFRLHNEGAKIEYLPFGHKENLNDPEEEVRARTEVRSQRLIRKRMEVLPQLDLRCCGR